MCVCCERVYLASVLPQPTPVGWRGQSCPGRKGQSLTGHPAPVWRGPGSRCVPRTPPQYHTPLDPPPGLETWEKEYHHNTHISTNPIRQGYHYNVHIVIITHTHTQAQILGDKFVREWLHAPIFETNEIVEQHVPTNSFTVYPTYPLNR